MDKITSDTLFKINQMFNFVEPIDNPTELTIGDTSYDIHVYAGYKITVDNTVTHTSTDFKDFMSFYDFMMGVSQMKTLYAVKYGCGQWEDYHEDIEYMYEAFDDAKQKCLQLQSEIDQRLQENKHWYDTLNKLDNENIEGIYNEVTGRTSCGVSFYEFVDSPNDFPRILDLFDDNMQEKLLLYAEAVEHVDSISIFDNEWDNPHYFMSVYEWLDDGSMKWIDAFGSEKLENMSCLKQN